LNVELYTARLEQKLLTTRRGPRLCAGRPHGQYGDGHCETTK